MTSMIKPAAVLFFAIGLSVFSASPSQALPPPTPHFEVSADLYGKLPAYECLQTDPHRSGVERFASMVLAAYPSTQRGDVWAPCNTHGATSLHHAGRAWDWVLANDGEVASPEARGKANELLGWLLEPVNGQRNARARRLGMVEVIWFNQLWTTQSRSWVPYSLANCSDPRESNTACHRDHVHFGFSRAGADGNTSWWHGLYGLILSTIDWLLP